MPYDYLIIATGARHAYFGHDDWAPFAPGLKTLEDATAIRRKLLLAFERAEREPDPAHAQALLTFVIIGGGADRRRARRRDRRAGAQHARERVPHTSSPTRRGSC